ncbi:MAG: helix-turn-helix transcriptional regulator [Ruminococcus sp.]
MQFADFLKSYYPALDSVSFNLQSNKQAQDKIKNVIRQMIPLAHEKPDFGELTMLGLLAEIYRTLLCECIENKRKSVPNKSLPDNSYAKKAIEYIDMHYREDISLATISDYIGLTPTYFANIFKKITNTSFIHFLNVVRLEKALADIIHNDMSVKDAAEQNGFSSVKSLISYCKQVYGCTPGEYKKRVSNEKK